MAAEHLRTVSQERHWYHESFILHESVCMFPCLSGATKKFGYVTDDSFSIKTFMMKSYPECFLAGTLFPGIKHECWQQLVGG